MTAEAQKIAERWGHASREARTGKMPMALPKCESCGKILLRCKCPDKDLNK